MTTRIETLLSNLSLEEKVTMLAGKDTWRTHAIERLGISPLKVTDGPNGVRGENKDTKSQTSASFPIGTAMGATWNPELVHEIGVALGEETKAKGAHVLLGPTVNVHRHPLAGRNFECFSEDPHLSSRMAVSYIQGVQSEGVGTCIKHFVANDQEHERFSISSEVDMRTLREIYLPAFKAAVEEAQPWTLMSAYNRVNGTFVSENKTLLNEILKDEWGFDGMVISDWYGTYSENVPAAGLDLEMPGPARWMGEKVIEAVQNGTLDEAVIDDKVLRILRTLERVGALDNPGIAEEQSIDNPAHRELIRKAGSEAIVLLKNDDNLLPVNEKKRSVAVIGRPAKINTFQGGGSSEVNPHYVVHPLEAIQNRYSDAFEINYAPGPSIHRMFPLLEEERLIAKDGTQGSISVQQFDNTSLEGKPFKEFLAGGTQQAWFGEKALDHDPAAFSLRMEGSWTAPKTGTYTFSLVAVGRARWWLGDEKMLDWWDLKEFEQPDNFDGIVNEWIRETKEIHLEAGETYPIKIEFASLPGGRWRTIRLGCLPPQPADPIADAANFARKADVAIVFAGLTFEWEGEGQDRINMDLPSEQNELIEAVAAANSNTVVVLNSGSPLHMPWADKVKSILQMWYLGQEAGNAITDVLFGETEPGGRLPTSFPKRIEDNPAHLNFPGENGKVRYGEGLFVGYRYYDEKKIMPLFPFGHGLSYTDFVYDALNVEKVGDEVKVQVAVSNSGSRAGQDVVQVYVRDLRSSLVRPSKELKSFTKIALDAGETKTVRLTLKESDLAFYDDEKSVWVVEKGEFEILVGRSAGDIRLAGKVDWL
ncbi:MAG: beta-glucosidase [Chloroflexi bacterium]|nr:beta-glucosidase [Chloroflexota bacterium]